jgi:hypothetical protein
MNATNNSFDPSDLELLADALSGKKVGNGYKCTCPAHDDAEASLSISPGDNTPLVWHCHAGCDSKLVGQQLRAILGKPPMKKNLHQIPAPKKTLVATYSYYRPDKSLAYEKLRYATADGRKTFSFRFLDPKGERWIWEKPADQDYLYFIVKALRLPHVPVIICEGEKDCDRLNHLLGDDYVAVTNDNGASGWTVRMTRELGKERPIIIAEDNDAAGRKRSRAIADTLFEGQLLGVLRFSNDEVGEKGDISDWLDKQTEPALALQHRLSRNLQKVDAVYVDTGAPKKEKESKDDACREDYYKVMHDLLGEMRRDIFGDSLLYFDKQKGFWRPVANQMGALRSEVRELTQSSNKRYHSAAVTDHFEAFWQSQTPRIVQDIPAWDGRDRVKELCDALVFSPNSEISPEIAYEITKEWLANVFRKIEDPSMNSSPSREFILIMQGPQKIGKDYWLRTLVGGFGQWFTDMTISQNERDNLMQLHENAVLSISEFDRTNRMESGMIKDIITKWSTKLRSSYARESEFRLSRCSLVASVNPLDILRDSTGNTRYAILPLKSIKRSYTRTEEFSLQLLAQGQQLAAEGFVADRLAWALMSGFIEDMSPEDLGQELADWFEAEVEKWLETESFKDREGVMAIRERGYVEKHEVEDILDRGGRVWKLPRRAFLQKLYASGLRAMRGGQRKRVLLLTRPVGE